MSQPPYPGPPYPEEPNQGQPYSGQPHPDAPPSYEQQPPAYGQQPPAYGQQPPAYGQQPPAYGQQPSYGQQPPAYGEQPAYGPPGYGDQPPYQPPPGFSAPPPPRRKPKTLPIVLVSLGVVLVLCVGAGTAIVIAGRNKAKEIVDSARDAATSVPTTGGTPTTEPTRESGSTITVTEPKTLGGRPKLTDAQFKTLADELESGLADVPNATATVGALYGTPAKRDIVVIAGAAAPIDDPKRELDSTFLGAGIGGLKVSGITSADPGSLGGVAKCGKADEQDIDMAMCGWADDGSVGWIMFFFKSVKSAQAEFPKLRAQIEKKSS
jgi:hypothetical protein